MKFLKEVVFMCFMLAMMTMVTTAFECPPKDDSGSAALLYPSPTSCSQFYMCSNGRAIMVSCQPFLHFNPRLKVCDFMHKAHCAIGAAAENQ